MEINIFFFYYLSINRIFRVYRFVSVSLYTLSEHCIDYISRLYVYTSIYSFDVSLNVLHKKRQNNDKNVIIFGSLQTAVGRATTFPMFTNTRTRECANTKIRRSSDNVARCRYCCGRAQGRVCRRRNSRPKDFRPFHNSQADSRWSVVVKTPSPMTVSFRALFVFADEPPMDDQSA